MATAIDGFALSRAEAPIERKLRAIPHDPHSEGNVLSMTDRRLRDHRSLQFRFLTSPTPAMRAEARRMAERAKDMAIEAGCCGCAPWEECDHRDHREMERWWRRGWKLVHADDDALMKVFSASMTEDVWPVVDRLIVGRDCL